MKKQILIYALLAALGFGNSSCNAQNKKPMEKQVKTEKLEAKKPGLFKYYQAEIKTGAGIEGKVLLNDSTLYEFTRAGGSSSYNLPGGMVKNGINKLHLVVTGMDAQPETATILSKANVLVILHGLNEPGWPDENSEVLKIEWLSTMEKDIVYEFRQGN